MIFTFRIFSQLFLEKWKLSRGLDLQLIATLKMVNWLLFHLIQFLANTIAISWGIICLANKTINTQDNSLKFHFWLIFKCIKWKIKSWSSKNKFYRMYEANNWWKVERLQMWFFIVCVRITLKKILFYFIYLFFYLFNNFSTNFVYYYI